MSYLESAAAALETPGAIALVVQFLGQWRRLRPLIVIGATYFSGIALVCIAATFAPRLAWFPSGPAWAISMLAGILPEFSFVGWLLFRHARRASAEARRERSCSSSRSRWPSVASRATSSASRARAPRASRPSR